MDDGLTNSIEAGDGVVEKRFADTTMSTALVRVLEATSLTWRDHTPETRRQREEQARELLDALPEIHETEQRRITMEEVPGERLDTLLEDPQEAAAVGEEVAAFMDELEEANISLLDSRASNFIIDDDLHRIDAEFLDTGAARRIDEITLLATVFQAPRRGVQAFLRTYKGARHRTPPLVYTMAFIAGLCFAIMVERSPRQASRTVQNYLSLFL